MLLINFSHPLTETQQAQIEAQVAQSLAQVLEIATHFDPVEPFAGQVTRLIDSIGLDTAAWQQTPLLIIPPALNFGTAAVLAELHGRCGYFPPVVRLRPIPNRTPPQYEIAEVINLQALRDDARHRR